MYYDGNLKSYSTVTRSDNNPFSITIRVDGDTDPSKVWFFFWAGNQNDAITENKSTTTGIAALDYTNKTVVIDNYNLNNKESSNFNNINFQDSFTGYYQFSTTDDKSVRSTTFTLKRPFAEIQILTDDFLPETSDLYKDFPNGVTSYVGLGTEKIDSKNLSTQLTYPNKWNYETGQLDFSSNGKLYFRNLIDQTASGKNTQTYSTTFKDRKMHFVACFHIFAPAGGITSDKILNVGLVEYYSNRVQNYESCNRFFSVKLPEEGIKANNKYIIYDKSREDGGTGFLDGYFDYEILINHDDSWIEPNTEQESDRLTE